MAVTLRKWGNGIGIRLPKPMLERLDLKEGMRVEVLVKAGHLLIRRERLKLSDLLAQCRRDNRPDPIEFLPQVGRELI